MLNDERSAIGTELLPQSNFFFFFFFSREREETEIEHRIIGRRKELVTALEVEKTARDQSLKG